MSEVGGVSAERMRHAVIAYFEACNAVDVEKLAFYLSPTVVHYLPIGMGGPFHGIEAIAQRWGADVRSNNSHWVVDDVFVDEERQTAIAEWSGFKPRLGRVLRGSEIYRFAENGLIDEVRIYYASP